MGEMKASAVRAAFTPIQLRLVSTLTSLRILPPIRGK
jgi:hypothetical protein